MDKTVTLKKQKPISTYSVQIGKLKRGVKTSSHKSTRKLRSTKKVAEALAECLLNGDTASFKEILSAHISLITNKRNFSKKIGIGRATLYEALSPDGNPSLETVARIVHSLAA